MIQAITFDFWDTLFASVDSSALRCRLIKHVLDQAGHGRFSDAQIERAITQAWAEWGRVWVEAQRTFGASRWVDVLLADLGVDLQEVAYQTLVHTMETVGTENGPPLLDGVADLLARLDQRYRLAVICDTGLSPGWLLRKRIDACGLLDYFDHLTFSDELGVSKPHPDAFLTTLARLGVAPEYAVHIGDYPRTDIAGAQGVGMRAIRFIGSYDRPDETIRADAAIVSYRELEPLLERWRASYID